MSYNRLPQIAATLPRRVQASVKAGAELIAEEARHRVPDAPPLGEGLVDAIHVEYTRRKAGEGGGGGYLVVAGDEDVFYGHLVEFGTVRSAPHPFLLPAAEAKREEVVGLVNAALAKL